MFLSLLIFFLSWTVRDGSDTVEREEAESEDSRRSGITGRNSTDSSESFLFRDFMLETEMVVGRSLLGEGREEDTEEALEQSLLSMLATEEMTFSRSSPDREEKSKSLSREETWRDSAGDDSQIKEAEKGEGHAGEDGMEI